MICTHLVHTPSDRSVNTPSYRMGECNHHLILLATRPALGQCDMLQNQLTVPVLISHLKAASLDLFRTDFSDTAAFSQFHLMFTQSQRFTETVPTKAALFGKRSLGSISFNTPLCPKTFERFCKQCKLLAVVCCEDDVFPPENTARYTPTHMAQFEIRQAVGPEGGSAE